MQDKHPLAVAPVVRIDHEGVVAVVTINAPPVNALSALVREGLLKAFADIRSSSANAIVLICDGSTFVAGADITEFGAAPRGPQLPAIVDCVEAMDRPVIAAMHGTALGGGLELALGAHYRIAALSARLGLPEVALGLLPGAGGTQRLPRLIGAPAALEIITSGRQVGAIEARELGLIDALAPDDLLRETAVAFAAEVAANAVVLPRVRDMDEKLNEARCNGALFADFRASTNAAFRQLDAPKAIIACIEAAVNSRSFEEGMAEEARQFKLLLDGPQSKARRYNFFAERAAAKLPGAPDDVPLRTIRSIGIVGAGTMGGGIAINFADAGIPVKIVEVQSAALERGLAGIRANLDRLSKRRGGSAYVERCTGLITGALDLAELAECDLVIEAVFEQMDVKLGIFRQFDAVCKPGAILATNTSALDVNVIAAATARPQDVIGLHFFSPAHIMRLLEVVRGEATSQDVVMTAMKLARKIGKIAVVSGVCDGFIGNRMLFKRQDQARALLREGASPWAVDHALQKFGFPMGPFAMEDLAGLDIGWVESESQGRTLNELMCEAGRKGQKVGAGYYDYDEKRRPVPSASTEAIIRKYAEFGGAVQIEPNEAEILERCLFPMINEGAKVLEEGIALRASDIDVVWINGYGWPAHLGGPMYHADRIGPGAIVAAMWRYHEAGIAGFEPSALLQKLADERRGFSSL